MSSTKKSVQVARPAGRYFRGKPGAQAAADSSDSEAESDPGHDEAVEARKAKAALAQGREMGVSLGSALGVDNQGRVVGIKKEESSSEEESSEEEEDEPPKPTFRAPPRPAAAGSAPAQPSADAESSSEYETDSEEEEVKKPVLRPTFVPKRARETILTRDGAPAGGLTEEAQAQKAEAEEEKRKKDSHFLAAESIKRELAEKEAPALVADVDDSDDPPQEAFEAWRLRELTRLTRDREAAVARQKERDEIERRREMPEAERMREDVERAKRLREEKQARGPQVFGQKFSHKGAFHQDDDFISSRDYSGATESTVDMSMLPKVMQKRNFGKMSQTKYTHLADQDTSRVGGKPGGGGGGSNMECFRCGGDHMKKDCPQLNDNPYGGGASSSSFPGDPRAGTGANSALAGPSRWNIPSSAGGSSSRYGDRDRPERSERRDDWGGHADVRERDDGRAAAYAPRGERADGRFDDRRDEYRSRRWSRSRSRERSPRRGDGYHDGGARDDRGGGGAGSRDRPHSRERARNGDDGKRRRYD